MMEAIILAIVFLLLPLYILKLEFPRAYRAGKRAAKWAMKRARGRKKRIARRPRRGVRWGV